MLLKDDKKKMASLIIGKLGKPEEKMEETPTKDGVETDSSLGLQTCAEEIISAVEQKDPAMLIDALKSALEMLREDVQPSQPEETEY
jgi:hypothetical protein